MFGGLLIAGLIIVLCVLMGRLAHAQTASAVTVNRLGTSGAGISVGTSSAVEVLPGNTHRLQYCVKCTVPTNATWTDPSSGDLGPAVTPTSSVGYPQAANTDYCEDARTYGAASVTSREDLISTSGSGTCYTREEQ